MKILSIIIPVYNSAAWLPKCIDSVFRQGLSDNQIEVICINDGSADNSPQIIHSYQERHSSVILINQKNMGPSGARNTGMKYATGKYLIFIDPDDYLEPNSLPEIIDQMESEQLDMLRFNFQVVDEQYLVCKKLQFELDFDYTPQLMTGAQFLAERLDVACNIWRYMYRSSIIKDNNIWCFTGDYYDDVPWLPLVLLQAKRINTCDKIVYNYYTRADSLVNNCSPQSIDKKIEGSLLLLKYLEDERTNLICEKEFRNKVLDWYKTMEAHIVINLLTITAVYRFGSYCEQIRKIKAMGVLPLKINNRYGANVSRKVRLINYSPFILMLLVYIKSNTTHRHNKKTT